MSSTSPEYRLSRTDLDELKLHVVPGVSNLRWHSELKIWDAGESSWCTCRVSPDRILLCLISLFGSWHSYTHTQRNGSQILKLIKHLVKMSDDSFPRTSLHPLVTPGERLRLSRVHQEIWKSSAKWLWKLSAGSEPCRPFSGLVYQAAPSPLCELHSLIGVLRVH